MDTPPLFSDFIPFAKLFALTFFISSLVISLSLFYQYPCSVLTAFPCFVRTFPFVPKHFCSSLSSSLFLYYIYVTYYPFFCILCIFQALSHACLFWLPPHSQSRPQSCRFAAPSVAARQTDGCTITGSGAGNWWPRIIPTWTNNEHLPRKQHCLAWSSALAGTLFAFQARCALCHASWVIARGKYCFSS